MNDRLDHGYSTPRPAAKLPLSAAILAALGDVTLNLPPGAAAAIDRFTVAHLLTRREKEVVTLICCGCKNDKIATTLDLSSPTVRFHLRNIHRKSGTSDKLDIVLRIWADTRPNDSLPS